MRTSPIEVLLAVLQDKKFVMETTLEHAELIKLDPMIIAKQKGIINGLNDAISEAKLLIQLYS